MLPYDKRLVSILFAAAVFLCFFKVESHAGEIITVGGTGSALGSMKIIGGAFEKSHPGVTVTVLRSLGSAGAIDALSKGAIDIAVLSRQLKREENRNGFSVIEYGRTPFVFVTSMDVPVSNITSEDIIKIYLGEKKTWPDGGRIRIRLRPAWDTETVILRGISPAVSRAIDVALARQDAAIGLTSQDNADTLEKTPGAFGYCTLAQVVSEKRDLNILSFGGVVPNPRNLANHTYPASIPLIILTSKTSSKAVNQLIRFLRSPKGIKIMEATGHLVTNR